ncbi:ATPase family AAA domain-containing protein FIGL1-like [Tripterygium wilfordii]|uniref:ATPase family AAA domain-containing protein FIGL1-like n=1 Tax=Tripterygium wilfordii TaxID=458696 RepID=UPI0018F826D0|nr:ATPase family AAA domain-containing protein FIGL1-like [Tripterygium wilfordii]
MKKEGRCWRKEVDEKLRRLHSLCFGADHALERHDYESAHSTLGLSLVGFLDSTSITLANEFLARQIRLDAASKVYQARHALTPESDRLKRKEVIQILWERNVSMRKSAGLKVTIQTHL